MIGGLQDLYRKDAFIGLNSKRGLSLIFSKYKLTAENNLLHPHGFIFPQLEIGSNRSNSQKEAHKIS